MPFDYFKPGSSYMPVFRRARRTITIYPFIRNSPAARATRLVIAFKLRRNAATVAGILPATVYNVFPYHLNAPFLTDFTLALSFWRFYLAPLQFVYPLFTKLRQ